MYLEKNDCSIIELFSRNFLASNFSTALLTLPLLKRLCHFRNKHIIVVHLPSSCATIIRVYAETAIVGISIYVSNKRRVYEVCPKSKCTDFLFKCLLDSPEIISYLLQSIMTLGKLHSGSNFFSTDHSNNERHFP